MNRWLRTVRNNGATAIYTKAYGQELYDLGVNDLHGDLFGGPLMAPSPISERFTQSLSLNGISQYAKAQDPTDTLAVTSSWSLEIWYQIREGTTRVDQTLCEWGTSATNGFRIKINTATTDPIVVSRVLEGVTDVQRRSAAATPPKPNGKTNQAVIVYAANDISVYINGEASQGGTGLNPGSPPIDSVLHIGRRDNVSEWFDGRLLPIVVYPNVALTLDQVRESYRYRR